MKRQLAWLLWWVIVIVGLLLFNTIFIITILTGGVG